MTLSRRQLPLNAMRAFEVTARLGQLRLAAVELGVTHGAVSRQLRQLEEVLATDLFDRSAHRLALTAAGRRLQQTLEQAFDAIADSTQYLDPASMHGRLVVASTPSVAVGWLLQVVGSFSQRYPEVELQLVNIEPLQREIPSEVDVALCYGQPEVRQRSAEPLFKERYVPVCSPRLLKPAAPIGRPADLLQYPLVHDRHLLWRRWLPTHAGVAAGSHNLHFQEAFQALAAVREGFGIGLADRLEISNDLRNGNLLSLLDQAISAEHSYYLVAQPASRQHVRARLFVESIRAEVSAYSE